MLQKIIKHIRSKPESVRKGITLGISLGITGVIAIFWFISFLNYSSQILAAKPKVESPTTFLNKMSFLIGESYANVRTKISNQTNFVTGNVEVDNQTNSVVEQATTSDSNVISLTHSSNDSVGGSIDESINDSSKSLNDILNTKKQVKQDDGHSGKATTSSEVLVQ